MPAFSALTSALLSNTTSTGIAVLQFSAENEEPSSGESYCPDTHPHPNSSAWSSAVSAIESHRVSPPRVNCSQRNENTVEVPGCLGTLGSPCIICPLNMSPLGSLRDHHTLALTFPHSDRGEHVCSLGEHTALHSVRLQVELSGVGLWFPYLPLFLSPLL